MIFTFKRAFVVLTVEFNDHLFNVRLMKLDPSVNRIWSYFIPIVLSDFLTILPLPCVLILLLRTL